MNNSEVSPEVNAKIKKNLVVIFLFAVAMIFAGLTSGYIVSQGGSFWVNIKMPLAFKISTTLIVLSSVFLILAVVAVKKNQQKVLKIYLGLAFILGLGFGVYQIKGWGQLIDNGNFWNGQIINIKGQYGNYYSFLYKGKEVSYDNGTFYLKGEKIDSEVTSEMKEIARQFIEGSSKKKPTYNLPNYGTLFTLKYKGELVTYLNNQLYLNNVPLAIEQHSRLRYFSESIIEDRGDFIMKGKYGEDFQIFYHGKPLKYENRTFSIDGKLLSPKQMNDLNTQDNTASSYIYAFTFMHLLHWIGGVIALLVVFINGAKAKYTTNNYLGISLASIYWHFLGILWLYLYAFLIFIH